MFDESAAVPAADEDAAFPDESQPLGPYTCTMDEAGGCHSATACRLQAFKNFKELCWNLQLSCSCHIFKQ